MNLSAWRNPNASGVRREHRVVGYREGKQWEPPKREKSGVIAPLTFRQQQVRDILEANRKRVANV